MTVHELGGRLKFRCRFPSKLIYCHLNQIRRILAIKTVRITRYALPILLIMLTLGAVAATLAGRTSGTHDIRADQLNAGGLHDRSSTAYVTRDALGAGLAMGKTTSSSYVNRGGLIPAIADPKTGDLDENGRITIHDVFLLSQSWMTEPGDEGYHFRADLVQDVNNRRVDAEDFLEMIRLMRNR